MALYPFMLFKDQQARNNQQIIRHELIHFRQQLELLILPFYLLYVLHYLINLILYRNHHRAYMHICFEQEAYEHDSNPQYLTTRKPYAWLKKFV